MPVNCESPQGLATMIAVVQKFLSPFVRCWHTRRSPLITLRPESKRSGVAALTGTYCVCLGCGKEFAYDWERMRFIDPQAAGMNLKAAGAELDAAR